MSGHLVMENDKKTITTTLTLAYMGQATSKINLSWVDIENKKLGVGILLVQSANRPARLCSYQNPTSSSKLHQLFQVAPTHAQWNAQKQEPMKNIMRIVMVATNFRNILVQAKNRGHQF
jgi:hypothetical protein